MHTTTTMRRHGHRTPHEGLRRPRHAGREPSCGLRGDEPPVGVAVDDLAGTDGGPRHVELPARAVALAEHQPERRTVGLDDQVVVGAALVAGPPRPCAEALLGRLPRPEGAGVPSASELSTTRSTSRPTSAPRAASIRCGAGGQLERRTARLQSQPGAGGGDRARPARTSTGVPSTDEQRAAAAVDLDGVTGPGDPRARELADGDREDLGRVGVAGHGGAARARRRPDPASPRRGRRRIRERHLHRARPPTGTATVPTTSPSASKVREPRHGVAVVASDHGREVATLAGRGEVDHQLLPVLGSEGGLPARRRITVEAARRTGAEVTGEVRAGAHAVLREIRAEQPRRGRDPSRSGSTRTVPDSPNERASGRSSSRCSARSWSCRPRSPGS